MWRGTKIHANPGLEAQHDEQPNLIPRKKLCAFLSVFLILTVLIFAAIFSLRYFILLKFEAPYRQVRFSIVSASMSGLNPNATLSSPPVFTKNNHVCFSYVIFIIIIMLYGGCYCFVTKEKRLSSN